MRLGYVSDIDFDECSGAICHLIIPGPCRILGLFGNEQVYCIDYKCICQIGADIILVDVDAERCLK